MTQEEFIERCDKVFNGKYDYSLVNFKNTRTKVTIICPTHGEFEQFPSNHLRGRGCKKCSYANRTMGLDEFKMKAEDVHKGKYDYSKIEKLTNQKTKICVVCPHHGEFYVTPDNHLRGKGCRECSIKKSYSNTEQFKESATEIHGGFYDYDLVEYEHSKKPVIIKCPKHGCFEQLPNTHLASKGCPKCNNSKSKGELELLDFVRSIFYS